MDVYKLKNNKGVVTVKILIILSVLLSLSFMMIQVLFEHYSQNQLSRLIYLQGDDLKGQMDGYLLEHYGLFGIYDYDLRTLFSTKNNPIKIINVDLEPLESLSHSNQIRKQIINFMLLRMPSNYLDMFLTRLDIIKTADNTNQAIDLKTTLDLAFGTLEQYFNQSVIYSIKINAFNPEVWRARDLSLIDAFEVLKKKFLSVNQIVEILYENYLSSYDIYLGYLDELNLIEVPTVEMEEKLRLFKAKYEDDKRLYEAAYYELTELYENLRILNIDYEKHLKVIDTLISDHKMLLDILKKIESKKDELKKMCGITTQGILAIESIEEVSNTLVDEIDKLNQSLESKNLDVIDDMTSKLENNLVILNKINTHLVLSFENSISKQQLAGYQGDLEDYSEERNKKINPEDEAYYKKFKRKGDETFEESYEGEKVKKQLKKDTGEEEPSIFKVKSILSSGKNLLEEFMINEYIVSTFTCFSQASSYDYDFFDKYNREKYFQRGEVEYILFGKDLEIKNVDRTIASIFAIRVLMNGIHVYLDKDKMSMSESIGMGVAGWTGFGGPLITNIIRVGWSVGESFIDMKKLLKGEIVPVLKLYPEEWELEVGLSKKTGKRKSLGFSYHDYLRVLLLTLDSETKMNRLVHLIELNLYKGNRPYSLNLYHTHFFITTSVKIGPFNQEQTLEVEYE
ncbi:MAG: hypothetical protein JXR88_13565 [Clostridia bacterium]|nr:hypothetical protein [Clostridia bacterium]